MNRLTDRDKQLIDRYLTQELENHELPEWELKMQDPIFSQAVATHQAVIENVVEAYKQNEWKQQFQSASERYHKANSEVSASGNIVSLLARRIRIVAAIVVLGIVGLVGWANSQYSGLAIAQSLQDSLLDDTGMGQINVDSIMAIAKGCFFGKEYERALREFSLVPRNSKHYPEAQILKAYTFFQLQEYQSAISLFDEWIDDNYDQLPNQYRNENKLRWTRLLAYVGANDTDTDFFKLELYYFLNSNSEHYSDKAEQLKNKLESPWRRVVFF